MAGVTARGRYCDVNRKNGVKISEVAHEWHKSYLGYRCIITEDLLDKFKRGNRDHEKTQGKFVTVPLLESPVNLRYFREGSEIWLGTIDQLQHPVVSATDPVAALVAVDSEVKDGEDDDRHDHSRLKDRAQAGAGGHRKPLGLSARLERAGALPSDGIEAQGFLSYKSILKKMYVTCSNYYTTTVASRPWSSYIIESDEGEYDLEQPRTEDNIASHRMLMVALVYSQVRVILADSCRPLKDQVGDLRWVNRAIDNLQKKNNLMWPKYTFNKAARGRLNADEAKKVVMLNTKKTLTQLKTDIKTLIRLLSRDEHKDYSKYANRLVNNMVKAHDESREVLFEMLYLVNSPPDLMSLVNSLCRFITKWDRGSGAVMRDFLCKNELKPLWSVILTKERFEAWSEARTDSEAITKFINSEFTQHEFNKLLNFKRIFSSQDIFRAARQLSDLTCGKELEDRVDLESLKRKFNEFASYVLPEAIDLDYCDIYRCHGLNFTMTDAITESEARKLHQDAIMDLIALLRAADAYHLVTCSYSSITSSFNNAAKFLVGMQTHAHLEKIAQVFKEVRTHIQAFETSIAAMQNNCILKLQMGDSEGRPFNRSQIEIFVDHMISDKRDILQDTYAEISDDIGELQSACSDENMIRDGAGYVHSAMIYGRLLKTMVDDRLPLPNIENIGQAIMQLRDQALARRESSSLQARNSAALRSQVFATANEAKRIADAAHKIACETKVEGRDDELNVGFVMLAQQMNRLFLTMANKKMLGRPEVMDPLLELNFKSVMNAAQQMHLRPVKGGVPGMLGQNMTRALRESGVFKLDASSETEPDSMTAQSPRDATEVERPRVVPAGTMSMGRMPSSMAVGSTPMRAAHPRSQGARFEPGFDGMDDPFK